MLLKQNKINHVLLLIDRSGSMRNRASDVIRVVDNQVAFLAQLSKDSKQETRVTIYIFDDVVECIVFDTDVLRLPSIAPHYRVRGQTALRDAFIQGHKELAQTCQLYGDHAFLIFGFTDGYENASRSFPHELRNLLTTLPENWTAGILVPDINGMVSAEAAGFAKGNISIWNTQSATGVEEAGSEIQQATQDYFTMRASGQTGTRTLFSTASDAVNADAIKAAGLQPLDPKKFMIVPVSVPREKEGAVQNKDNAWVWEISTFVKSNNGGVYKLGSAYYKLSKQEIIGPQKSLAVLEKATGRVYVGDGVRPMIGLGDKKQRVAPDFNKEYEIYVQSQSPNRHLKKGDQLLVLK